MVNEDVTLVSQALSGDEALIQIGERKFVFTYETLYDLAFRTAHLLTEMGRQDDKRRIQ